ncbi:MAG: glycine zipper domain-containing protein [Bacillota bacterium]
MVVANTMSGVLSGGLAQIEDTFSLVRGKLTWKEYSRSTTKNITGGFGFAAGLSFGAAIGSSILPGLGTIFGSFIGGLFGWQVGRQLGNQIGQVIIR